MILYSFPNGDQLSRRDNSLIITFAGMRRVLSTSPHNGGLRDDIMHVFNHCAERTEDSMRGSSYCEHIAILASELGLDPKITCGISTGAYAENVAIVTNSYLDTEVTAIVTAGIDINGSRVGDKTEWHESENGYLHVPGTINILLIFSSDLTPGALTRALITCTEAKSAAIAELCVPSCYSQGLATGSGTDGAILVCDPNSPVKLTEAGTHFKLGELIGITVIEAVKKALYLETGLNEARQFDFFRRLGRHGISIDSLLNSYVSKCCTSTKPDQIRDAILYLTSKREIVVFAILIANILDQLSYNLITDKDALMAANNLFTDYFPASDLSLNTYLDCSSISVSEQIISTTIAIIIDAI